MALKFYISVAKPSNLKFRKLWGLITAFVKVTGEELVEELLGSPFGIGLTWEESNDLLCTHWRSIIFKKLQNCLETSM